MPTLQELAAEQSGNASNPWIQQYAADLAKEQQAPRDLGEIDQPPVRDLGEIDTPTHAGVAPTAPSPKDGLAKYADSLKSAPEPGAPPPPPPGMLPVPGANDNARPEPGAHAGAPVAAGVAGPAGMSPDRRYDEKLTELEGRNAEVSDLERQGIVDQAKIYQKGTLDRAIAEQVRKDEETVLQGKQEAAEQQFEAEAKARSVAIQQRSEQVRAMHVDPQKWYKDRGTAGTVLAALASALGAFGAAMPHSNGKNAAQEILDKSMDREVHAQEKNIDDAWRGLESQVSDSDRDYARGQHKIATMQAAKIEAWSHATAQIQSVMARTEDQAKIAGMQGLLAHSSKQQLAAEEDYAKQHREVGNHILAQQQAAANARAAEAKKRTEWIREHAQKVALNPATTLSDEAKKRGITVEEAAVRQAEALYDGNRANSGLVRQERPGATAKADQKAAEANAAADKLGAQGSKIGSVWSNPSLIFGTSGSEGQANRQALDAWNSEMISKVHATSVGLRSPELVKEITGPFHLSPWDGKETIKLKIKSAQDYLRANPPANDNASPQPAATGTE